MSAVLSTRFNRDAFEEAFYDFLKHVTIVSKNSGPTIIDPYRAQRYALDQIFDGLANGIHWFVILKARQLGITTLTLLLDLFWCALYPGLQGALVTDNDPNKEKLRLLVTEILDYLPKSHPLPIRKHNRNGLVFENGSMIDYLVAGTQKRKGALGRSRALNFMHSTETAQYGDIEGWESLMSSLSDTYPWRLYVVESTAHGYNLFENAWQDSISDDLTKRAVFIGWWQHDEYLIPKGTPLFQRYGYDRLSDDEAETAKIVKETYDWTITLEQWAWYRHRKDPQRRADSGEIDEGKGEIIEVEFPSYAEEAFRMSGSPFLPGRTLDQSMKVAQEQLFKAYTYYFGDNFLALRRHQVDVARLAQLKVWQPPHPNGRYVVAADPAYASSDTADRFCLQVLRLYADRLVQVAEFAVRNMQPFQFTWVLADLCGWYGNCRYILEINGPGEAVMTEFRHLKTLLDTGKLVAPRQDDDGDDPQDGRRPPSPLANVSQYLFHRPDAISGSWSIQWKCLAVDTPLPTPDGWATMGEVAAGDVLFDEAGEECRVVGVSDVKENHECFRVTFDDGTDIVADAEHLWPVIDMWATRTIELRPGIDRLPVASPLRISRRRIARREMGGYADARWGGPVHPYVLGVWLGDGHSDSGRYSCHRDDIEEMQGHLEECGAELSEWKQEVEPRSTCYQSILGLVGRLREMGVLGNKHIPASYLRGSVESRWALLQGLMDTDGTICQYNGRQCSFTTSKPLLAEGFAELLRTLGIKAKFCVRHRKIEYLGSMVECAAAYQFWFTAYEEPVFRLKRKLARQERVNYGGGFASAGRKKCKVHKIIAVDPVESVPVRCIQVDSPSHLFLAGRGMIPTHNTTAFNKPVLMNSMGDHYMMGNLVVNSVPALAEMKKLVRKGMQIEADGNAKDDRAVALALGTRVWIDFERAELEASGRTFAIETARDAEDEHGAGPDYMTYVMQNHFRMAERQRKEDARRARRQGRWAW